MTAESALRRHQRCDPGLTNMLAAGHFFMYYLRQVTPLERIHL